MPKRKRYAATCCICGHAFYAALSIMQRNFGVNDGGHGHCPGCNEFLNLTFNPEAQRIETMKWSDYVQKLQDNREVAT